MKKLFVLIVVMFFFSCALPPKYASISMREPIQTSTNKFEDEKMAIAFSVPGHVGTYGSGFGTKQTTVYEGINFILTNKTDNNIILDWNKVSFIMNNMSGNAVMHKGIKYNECNNPKASSFIPPGTSLADIITPCFAVQWKDYGRYGGGWEVSMLPPVQTTQQVDFGVFLPLQFEGDETVNYKFIFRAKN